MNNRESRAQTSMKAQILRVSIVYPISRHVWVMDEQSFVFEDLNCQRRELKNVLPPLRSCLHRVRNILESHNWQLQRGKGVHCGERCRGSRAFQIFVEYLYRDQSILSRKVQHYSEFVTLARLYAIVERLLAPKFQSCVLWRFCESLGTGTPISEESICELLQITAMEQRVQISTFSLAINVI
jgi:hypothetical protein